MRKHTETFFNCFLYIYIGLEPKTFRNPTQAQPLPVESSSLRIKAFGPSLVIAFLLPFICFRQPNPNGLKGLDFFSLLICQLKAGVR